MMLHHALVYRTQMDYQCDILYHTMTYCCTTEGRSPTGPSRCILQNNTLKENSMQCLCIMVNYNMYSRLHYYQMPWSLLAAQPNMTMASFRACSAGAFLLEELLLLAAAAAAALAEPSLPERSRKSARQARRNTKHHIIDPGGAVAQTTM